MPYIRGTDVTRDTVFWLVLLAGVFRLFLNFRARLGGLFEFLLCLSGLVGQFADGFVAFFSAHDGSSFSRMCGYWRVPVIGRAESPCCSTLAASGP